ncbi:MAG: helix-turn-helix domain-containing protein [Cytophagaceae bacterium]|nr:helix-turn-helix domain-containing protein [Cytophagaceae bacterium]MDW8456489.1 helix-turn-helix domain-containing protein [Cytophagaceae bacterium]
MEKNIAFEQALKLVNQTLCNVFLTGKAGTGKTTFLHHIKNHSHKKLAIVAPTGVAAINAGGMTIHSFFQIPMGNFLPTLHSPPEGNFFNRSGLLTQLKINAHKRELIKELELLIIDEVSMLRADLLDAIHLILQFIRNNSSPFGGVQVLFIGDLFQLPPVARAEEWKVLCEYYESPFFHSAHCLRNVELVCIELKNIYRQRDSHFIELLNSIRTNSVTQQHIDYLNSFYKPHFSVADKGEYITITTHNSKAEQINSNELKKFKNKEYVFDAEIKGDFNESAAPADVQLRLKEGAQVMCIRNDKGEQSRYYNGKIGIVSKITETHQIFVRFFKEDGEVEIEKETWENIRYVYNSQTETIEKEVIGTFTQYPLRLAWAITIHKSQGLTFEKAVIDAGASFAPGQVYVALSRLTSTDGLVLLSPITREAIQTHQDALRLTAEQLSEETIQNIIQHERVAYLYQLIYKTFDLKKPQEHIQQCSQELDSRKIPNPDKAKLLFHDLVNSSVELAYTSEKFILQLRNILAQSSASSHEKLKERVRQAAEYYKKEITTHIIEPLKKYIEETKSLPRTKKYINDLNAVHKMWMLKLQKMQRISAILEALENENELEIAFSYFTENTFYDEKSDKSEISVQKNKKEKGATHRLSLEMYRSGKSIQQIATERNLAPATIEGHLASFVLTGEVDVYELVSTEKMIIIENAIHQLDSSVPSQIKNFLGDTYSYGEIKAVINFLERKKNTV